MRVPVTTTLRLARGALVAWPLGLFACHTGLSRDVGAPIAVVAASTVAPIIERAEPGPITSLACRGSVLVAGGARGVRRWDVNGTDYETLGADEGLPGNGVTAIGLDGARDIWVATDAGVGRFSPSPREKETAVATWKYHALGGLAGVTALAPTTSGHDVAAWAGGGDGLFRSDGTSWTPVAGVSGVVVTSLDLDPDGHSAWVGTRARGLFHVDGDHAREVPVGEDAAAYEDILGTALTAEGTRVAAARARDGSRLVFLEEGDPQPFRAQPDARFVRLVDSGKGAVLVAGPPGAERVYALKLLGAGEAPPPGGLRFVSVKSGMSSAHAHHRWVAVPLDLALPADEITAVAGGEGAVFAATARLGVARAAKGRADFLTGATLVGDAERLNVACAAPSRCFAVTDGPRAWLTDGDVYREVAVGEADDATVLAVVADHAGTIYALSSEPKYTGLVITRLARAAKGSAGETASGDLWKSFHRVPLALPSPGGPAALSFAAISPAGVLWVGLRAHAAGGDDVSAGALELDLASHHAVQHRATKQGEPRTPDMLPLPSALTDVMFEPPALWFSSLSGVSRWNQGELRDWGENEGIRSELVHGLARGAADTLWAATSEGLARFDGAAWRSFGGGGASGEESVVACRAIARAPGGDLWVATSKGLRRLTPDDVTAGRDGATVLPGDMRDVRFDRYGRAWALSSSAIALVRSPAR
ncbi:MAG: two component regulator propeller domain protein [Myxococcales bacterium]|nr:two component regulator propeller domain protein [Myxococcales bacterium]